MTEEVADIVLGGTGFEEARAKLATQIVKVQIDDARAPTACPPRALDRSDLLTHFVPENEAVEGVLLVVGTTTTHLKLGTQPLSDRNGAGLVGLGAAGLKHNPPR